MDTNKFDFSSSSRKKMQLPKLKLKRRGQNNRSSNPKSSCSFENSDNSLSLNENNESLNSEMDGNSSIQEDIEISENISANITSQSSESCELTPKFLDNINTNGSKLLQRNPFDIDDNPVFPSTSQFDIDDMELSAKNIAEHFKVIESQDDDDEKPKTPPILNVISFRNKKKLLQQNNDVDSLDQILNDIDSPKETTFRSDKELSPLVEDVVLINDNKVSLHSLKKNQKACEDNSLSTTHDISDLAKDTEESDKNAALQSEKIEEKSIHDSSIEEDNSIEELLVSNNSIEISGLNNFSALDPNINIDDESMMNRLLQSTIEIQEPKTEEKVSSPVSDLRERILRASKSFDQFKVEIEEEDQVGESNAKLMEKVSEFKEPLEDISEESELTTSHRAFESSKSLTMEKGKEIRKILEEKILFHNKLQVSPVNSVDENKENIPDSMSRTNTFDFDSVVSLNLFQEMEGKVKELQEVIAGKDACLQALNIQIDNYSRRSSFKDSRGDSLKEITKNSIESNSLATNSTEYRTINEEIIIGKMSEIQNEILSRDQLIEQLSSSLQQSMQVREDLQQQGEKLTTEVNQLRKLLTETMESLNKANNESNDYRISQISCDLVSDTDYGSNLPDDDTKDEHFDEIDFDINEQNPLFQISSTALSREVENFKKILDPSELRIFNTIQYKFDDFLQNEIDSMIEKYENETKVVVKKLETDKHERDIEINRLRQMLSTIKSGSTEISELRHELEMKHTQEMADLRGYFEKKCADMEKQYSEDVFSQQSKRMAGENSTDVSDEEEFPEENGGYHSKHDSPKKREIFASPTHQKITPTNLEENVKNVTGDDLASLHDSILNVKQHYTDKINEINRQNNEIVQSLSAKLKYYEDRYAEDDLTTLLSDTAAQDSLWPPELILLREKFTAECKLEIAQLQIKHEEEMARMKSDFEKQLQRKLKRQTTFDSTRDLDKIINERDNLREVSSTLRCVLGELAKYFSICEDDLNNTVLDELQKHGVLTNGPNLDDSNSTNLNSSTITNYSPKKYLKFTPDVSGIISVIEDPSFIDFISKTRDSSSITDLHLNLDDCMEKLRIEALNILGLSERLCKKNITDTDCKEEEEKRDSCEEEDGLKRGSIKRSLLKSFDENILKINDDLIVEIPNKSGNSLPLDLSNVQTKDEINVHLRELRNQLMKSESERCKLESELAEVLAKQDHLVGELNEARHQLIGIGAQGQGEVFSEGFGTNTLLPQSKNVMCTFSDLQNRAKHFLNSPQNNSVTNNSVLVQLVEDFCREGERYMDDEKREKLDLQAQIEAADKKLKTTRQFLEDQAAEREQERDDYLKEIEKLMAQLKDRDKDKANYDRANKEERCEECSTLQKEKMVFKRNMDVLEQQMKEFSSQIREAEEKKNKLENDLKDSIDKVFTLREIITELETQIESKALNERVMEAKIKELELYIDAQSRQNESLQQEMESFKTEVIVRGYDEKIANLEDQLRHVRPSDEQSVILDQMISQLKDIEDNLENKTKALEALHANAGTVSLSTSPSEDVSVAQDSPIRKANMANEKQLNDTSIIPIDEVQRIVYKLTKHTRVEDATIKRVLDMEMQMNDFRTGLLELQNERDALQDRMSEQSMKISTLQLRLDEQRLRAEELTRIGTSHLNIKVHDLQNELITLRDTLDSREKQITNLKELIENSQKVIEQREKELLESQENASRSEYERKLEVELKDKCDEIQQLKDKIKNEMISKKTVPDLMNTIVAEKDAEIEELKEKIHDLQKGQTFGKDEDNARTLSDIVSISEYDEADMLMRRMSDQQEGYLLPPNSLPMHDTQSSLFQNQSKDKSRLNEPLTLFGPPRSTTPLMAANFFHDATVFAREGAFSTTPEMAPRQINFSLAESSKSAEFLQKQSSGARIEEIKEEDELKILSDIEEEIIDNVKLKLEKEVESLKLNLEKVTVEKNQTIDEIMKELKEKNVELGNLNIELTARQKLFDDMNDERKALQNEVDSVKKDLLNLKKIEAELNQREVELKSAISNFNEKEEELRKTLVIYKELQVKMEESGKENGQLKQKLLTNESKIDTLQQQIESLNKTINHKDEILSKMEKDALNYAQNEQKYLENIKVLEAKECDLKILQGKYKDKEHEVQMLNEDNKFLNEDINRLKNEIVRSSSVNSNNSYIQYLKQSCDKVEEELHETKCTLTEKMMSLEKVRLDLTTCEKLIESLNDQLKEKDNYIKQVCGVDGNSSVHLALSTFQKKLKEEQNRNEGLEAEIERLKTLLQRSDNSSSPKPYSAEEIAEQIEKELNYSAQLDSSILKAIESDDLNSDGDEDDCNYERLIKAPSLKNVRETDEKDVEELKSKIKDLQCQLETEKRNAESIQIQDADIMEKMRLHLDTIIEDRNALQNLLEDEKNKNERLSNLVSGVQRTKSFDNYLLMKPRSPNDSPRHSRHNRSYDFEVETVYRLESEIKLLTAQNERERERARDLQTSLDRERNRFEKDIADLNDHMDKLKKELNRICKEKDAIEMELDHEQEKLMLAHKEIDNFEMRISSLQDAEAKRSLRRGVNNGSDIEIRIQQYEEDKAKMKQTINLLRADIDRGAQRETKMAEELLKDNSGSSLYHTVPEEFLIKLKEMNHLLESNTRENRQLAETLHLLTEERRALQQRVTELESHGSINGIQPYNQDDLQERANHLFGKYLRLESHRKALVHQKRYLLIVLATYEENEARTLSLLRAHRPETVFTPPSMPKKHRSFRIVVLAVIAIARMRYIVRRWLSGKYLGSKAIFSHQYYPNGPRRSYSATTNVWARSPNSHFAEYTHSPPSRDRNHQYLIRPLEAPNLVLSSEMRTRLEDQLNLNSR